MRVMPATLVELQYAQWSVSCGVTRWQELQMVNSGESVSCAAWVFSKVLRTSARTLAARGPLLADEGVDDGAALDERVELALHPDAGDEVHRRVGAQVDRVGVIHLVVGDAAADDLLRLRVAAQVNLRQPARRALRGRFLERELQPALLPFLLAAEVHVRHDLQPELEDRVALVELLAGEVLQALVQADQADDVGALFEVHVRAAVVGGLADLPERHVRLGHEARDEVLFW